MGHFVTETDSNLSAAVINIEPGEDVFGNGRVRQYTTDDQFVVPVGVSRLRVTVIGGGGGGGCGGSASGFVIPYPSGSVQVFGAITGPGGGGGGGVSIKTFNVTPGEVYDVTVGKGGIGGYVNSDENNITILPSGDLTQLTGTAGGTSSFGSVISATGGGGGTSPSDPSKAGVGGEGGIGIGGDRNMVGGAGGNGATGSTEKNVISGLTLIYYGGGAGGGGASWGGGRGGHGGSPFYTPADRVKGAFCGGGGGTGGRGGDGLIQSTPLPLRTNCGGGGSGGRGGDADDFFIGASISGPSFITQSILPSPYRFKNRLINDTFFRGTGRGAATGGEEQYTGAGGTSTIDYTNSTFKYIAAGGICGGGAGTYGEHVTTGAGGWAGGGGGGSVLKLAGSGGAGLVIVEW